MLSIPNRGQERPEIVEARAFNAGLRWLLRKRSRIGSRQTVLLDSQSVLGAARKGRSSSALKFHIRRTAALSIFGGIQLHVLYTPTDYNPADAPSRGIRRARGDARRSNPRRIPPVIKAWEKHRRALKRLQDTGVLSVTPSSRLSCVAPLFLLFSSVFLGAGLVR